MSKWAKHIEMEHCDICNGDVFINEKEEYECEKCGTVFRPKMGDDE